LESNQKTMTINRTVMECQSGPWHTLVEHVDPIPVR